MGYDPLRETSVRADVAAPARTAEEAHLEQYLDTPVPIHDWLEARVRQTPWWAISVLLHLILVIILCNWPVPQPPIEVVDGRIIIDIYEPPVREKLPDAKLPTVIPPTLVDFKIDPNALESTQIPGLAEVEAPPQGKPEPKGFEVQLPPVLNPMQMPDIIKVTNHTEFPRTGKVGGGIKGRPDLVGEPGDPRIGGPPRLPVVLPLTAALLWLERAQEKDGSWDAKRWDGSNEYRVGMTGLALLAYEGAGCTHQKGQFGTVVAKALGWLQSKQRENGSFPFETFYEQGIATMAVAEAYGMTEDEKLRPMAQKAVSYIVRLQPEHGGFRYAGPVERGQGDLSVTGWQIMAIKSAKLAGLDVPEQAFERSREFLKSSWREYGASAYLVGDAGPGSLSMTSVGLLCRLFLSEGGHYEGQVRQAADYLYAKETEQFRTPAGGLSKELVTDLYYTYYSSLAMFQLQGEYWDAWKRMYVSPLEAAQVKARTDARGRFVQGSFEPSKHKWGDRGGRVYTTAMAALCFEAPFRFIALYRVR